MSKRNRGFTDEKYEKWIKEGRGIGIGHEYKPWLNIQDVPSNGRTSRIFGNKTKRQHQLLSDLEKKYFYLLEFSDRVIDIREQYPLLSREDTLIIAEEIGVKHPTDPVTQTPTVITTDFLVTDTNNNVFARTIKPIKQLDLRQIEKFEIERRYWEKRNVNWGIVTEKEIDDTLAKNIEIVYPYHDISQISSFSSIKIENLNKLITDFKKILIYSKDTVRNEGTKFESRHVLKDGFSCDIFKYLIINKMIRIDMTKKFTIDSFQKITDNNSIYKKKVQ